MAVLPEYIKQMKSKQELSLSNDLELFIVGSRLILKYLDLYKSVEMLRAACMLSAHEMNFIEFLPFINLVIYVWFYWNKLKGVNHGILIID